MNSIGYNQQQPNQQYSQQQPTQQLKLGYQPKGGY